MRVLFLTKSKHDPATRYRAEPVMSKLRSRGCEVDEMEEPSFFSQPALLARLGGYDVVFIQRKLFNGFFLTLLASLARKVVYDFDDAVFCRSSGEVSRTRAGRFTRTVSKADLVLAGNRFLRDEALEFNKASQLIPTCVDPSRYDMNVEKPERFTLVWIGSTSTSRYLESHRKILEAVGERLPDIRLKVISDFNFDLNNMDVVNVAWSPESEIRELAASHIGIAPMTDDRWTRGKCALKIIQYMAAGLPVVSSSVGANRDVVIHDETGFLVDDEQSWCKAIDQLQSEALQERMGAAGRQLVRGGYSMDETADKVARLILAL